LICSPAIIYVTLYWSLFLRVSFLSDDIDEKFSPSGLWGSGQVLAITEGEAKEIEMGYDTTLRK
jgi:hypothetical protein